MPTIRAVHIVGDILAALMHVGTCAAGPTKNMAANRARIGAILMVMVIGTKLLVHTNPLAVSGAELIR
jgi:hypothetical protein